MDIFHKETCSPNTPVYKAKHMKYPTNILTEFVPVKTIWCKTKGQKWELLTSWFHPQNFIIPLLVQDS